MKKLICILLVFVLIGCSKDEEPSLINWESRESDRTMQIVNAFRIGEYGVVREKFNAELKSEFSKRKLKKLWEETEADAGEFIRISEINEFPSEVDQTFQHYSITVLYEERTVIIRIIFDAEAGFITGFNIRTVDQ